MDLSSIIGNLGIGGQSTQQSQAAQQGIRAYQMYKAEAEALGQPVLSPQDYLKQLQQQQQTAQPAPMGQQAGLLGR